MADEHTPYVYGEAETEAVGEYLRTNDSTARSP